MKSTDIIYEKGDYFVLKAKGNLGYEVYKNFFTHSVRCAIIGYSSEVGIQKAIEEIDRRIKSSLAPIKKGNYYDNSDLCGECTGGGCKQCRGKGVTRWPLSLAINGCKPPAISQPINRHAIPLRRP